MVRPTFEQVARSMKSVVSARALRAVQAVVAKGHVELITLSQDMVVARLLRGGREHVELVIDEQGGLRCHCPCRSREPFCEHGLAVLFAAAAAGPSPAGAGGDEPYPGMGREQLQSWASRHGVESWLMIRASDALHGPARFHRWVLSWEGRQLLLDVIAGPAEASRSAHGRAPLEVQRAALELLQEKKKEQELALEEEERWLARLVRPRDALVAPLWDRLRALREQVRRAARPRPAHTRGNVRIEVRLEPATLLVREQGVTALCGGGSNRAPCVTLDPGDARRPAAATCNCFRPHPEGCTVRLAAIDAALEQLASAPASAKLQELLRWLSLPAWERALHRLDDVLALWRQPALELDDGGELGWRVRFGPGGQPQPSSYPAHVTVDPVLVRPRKKGKGLAGRLLNSWEAWEICGSGRLRRPADLPVLELCDAARRIRSPADDAAQRLFGRALALLQDHPGVFWAHRNSLLPLAVRRATAALSARAAVDGAIELGISLGEQELSQAHGRQLLQSLRGQGRVALYFSADTTTCTVVEAEPRLTRLLHAMAEQEASFPGEAVAALLERLADLGSSCPCRIDPRLTGRRVEADLRPVARLERLPGEGVELSLLVRPLPELASFAPGEGPEQLLARRDGEPVHVSRDLAGEIAAVARLAGSLGLTDEGRVGACTWRITELQAGLLLLERLAGASEQDVVVEWANERRYRLTRSARPADLRLHLRERRGWFSLGGHLEVDGVRVELGELLRAIREKQGYVPVEGGLWVRIGEELRRHLAVATRATTERAGEPELSRFAAPLLEPLSEAGAELESPPAWQALRQRMDEARTLEPAIPAGLEGVLRGYQVEGFRWLVRLAHWGAGACLADDMGLGKTLQALALLRHRAGLGPALVVAPTTVVLNWQREAERFTPALRVRVLRGQAQLQLLDGLGPGDVVVTTYGLTTRYQDRLKALPFSTLVLDEAQAIKNPETQRARAVFHLQAPCRVALTGTPVENRAGELWSLFHAIAPGLLGSAESFRERFALPIERDRDQAAQELLARMIRPFVLRRLKAQVAPELPPRTEVRIDVELSREERVLYDELRASALAALAGVGGGGGANGGGEQQRRFQVLAALTRLRQLACHPQLVHPVTDVGSAKLAVLRELLAQLRHEGHRTLIFSQFTSHLALVRRMLEQEGVAFCAFDGSTPALQRRAEVDAFQGGSGEVFLLSLKAGGTGINLTAADYVVFLDPWWNPAVEDQAADRTHRIGQQRPVTIYRLVARDTIEEGILALQREKRELVQALLDGTGSAAALSTDELIGLIEASGRWSEAEPEEELEAETIPARSGTVQRRAAAASAAPAVPAAAGPGNGSSAAGDGPELLRRMELLLLRALAEGRLSNRATVRSYCRGAGRICEFAGAKGLPLDARSLEGIVASYRAELTRGSWPGPQSDAILARSVLHWMQNAAKLKEK